MRTRSVPLATLLAGALALACADAPTRPTVLPFDPALVVVPTDTAPPTRAVAPAAGVVLPQRGGAGASATIRVAVTDLGTLSGDWNQAYAINNAGQVVGEGIAADNRQRAFLWDRDAGIRVLSTHGEFS